MRLWLLLCFVFASTTAENVCDVCTCNDIKGAKDITTTHIECNFGITSDIIQDPKNWPYQLKENTTPNSFIDVHFDSVEIVRLHPLPAVPIVKFSSTHNHIATIDDEVFKGPSETIEEIDLSSNRLTSSLGPHVFRGGYSPKTLEPLPKLRVVKLKRNAIHSLHPDLFEHLPALEELYLDFNPMRVIDSVTVKAIATVIHLKVLSLSNTGLKTLPDTFLHTPRFLETLDISGNQMAAVPPTVGDARDLKTLILDGNPIRHFHNNSMPALPRLTKLSISRMPYLMTIEDDAFSGLTALRELECEMNPNLELIETYAMGVKKEEEEFYLTKLLLNNNHLPYLSRHLVLRWDRLKEVALYGNPWSCDCLNQWIVTDLAPILDGIDPTITKSMMCHQPPELLGKSMYDMEMFSPHMRCLDLYRNRPENDGAMLIGVLIGTLLSLPVALVIYIAWTRRGRIFAQCCPPEASSSGRFSGSGAADYSRAFYKRANTSVGDI